ncbi:hypothetical protein LSTR_LSTR003644 [Laodelphax striatellus]|uniref:Glycosyl hydrolases family 39 N-terminal catalytic domain-containing protein n=1 Tax=Laodelphax striatellus TaxID=195883 RepID=A0A482XBC9_LAOST|nr:hypothetical protein LSTR_LSTR003644 [Laodelphax striatellus]
MLNVLIALLCLTSVVIVTAIEHGYGSSGVVVDAVKPIGNITRFWVYTGFSPPEPREAAIEFLTSRDIEYNLALIGAVPLKGILFVRIHWLLELIIVKSLSVEGLFELDFAHLDTVIQLIVKNELHPVFELMGNPSGVFSDINNNSTQIELWKKIVTAVVSRYTTLYGVNELSKWKFETWNEPDLKQYNVLNFTEAGYMKYVEASRAGLNDAITKTNITLLYGGPAGLFKSKKKHKLCWKFLSHCSKHECNLNFISFHKKGNGSADKVVEDSIEMLNIIKDMYNGTQPPPLANTEADILSGWWRNESWRADVRYAAAVSMVLAGFIDRLNDDILILSNDNGFLNYHPHFFTQRTLFGRFQMNNTLDKHSQIFEKPVYSVMGILAYLGNEKLRFASTFDNRLRIIASTSRFGSSSSTTSIILVWSTDSMDINTTLITIPVQVFLPNISGKYAVRTLQNTEPHPSAVWLEAGSPVYPDSDLRRKMRKAQVTNLRAFNVTFNEVLILWSDTEIESRLFRRSDWKIQSSRF